MNYPDQSTQMSEMDRKVSLALKNLGSLHPEKFTLLEFMVIREFGEMCFTMGFEQSDNRYK